MTARGSIPGVVAKWEPSQVHLRPWSRARDESYLNTHVLPRFGDVPLAKIQNADIRAWIADLSASGLPPSTVGKAKQIVSNILQAAVDDRRIPVNPADRVPVPRIQREEMRCLTPAEVTKLADTIDSRYRALVLLGAYGGLRLGEMLGLRWGRVNLLRRRIQVAEISVEVKGEIIVGPPKTKAGARVVPLPTVVTNEVAALTDANPDPATLVFRSPQGAPASRRPVSPARLVPRDEGRWARGTASPATMRSGHRLAHRGHHFRVPAGVIQRCVLNRSSQHGS
jgi:integrase